MASGDWYFNHKGSLLFNLKDLQGRQSQDLQLLVGLVRVEVTRGVGSLPAALLVREHQKLLERIMNRANQIFQVMLDLSLGKQTS